mgnify:CR=1 FL=1
MSKTPKQVHGFRLWMLVLNTLPLLHLLSVLAVLFLPLSSPMRGLIAITVLYLLPPLLARFILTGLPIRSTRINTGSREFLIWWGLANLQALFVRFAFLEELLRLIPGVYSLWLRLWGAKLGKLIYWAPGTIILDRSFLNIGDAVVFGAGVRLNPHVIAADSSNEEQLLLADIVIGSNCVIGGYSLLTAGTEINSGEKTRAFLISPPFSFWKEGRRVRREENPESGPEQRD